MLHGICNKSTANYNIFIKNFNVFLYSLYIKFPYVKMVKDGEKLYVLT